MTDQEANIQINIIKNVQKERVEKYYSWMKNILTLAVGLFSILIAFKTNEKEHIYKSILYVFSIFSLGMGILSSLIVLYAEINVLDQTKKYQVERLIDMVDKKPSSSFEFESIKPKWIYRISGKLSLIFYLLSVFFLIAYSSFEVLNKILN